MSTYGFRNIIECPQEFPARYLSMYSGTVSVIEVHNMIYCQRDQEYMIVWSDESKYNRQAPNNTKIKAKNVLMAWDHFTRTTFIMSKSSLDIPNKFFRPNKALKEEQTFCTCSIL